MGKTKQNKFTRKQAKKIKVKLEDYNFFDDENYNWGD